MKKRLLTAVVGAFAIAASALSSAAPLVSDSFESGTFSAINTSSTINTSGFKWQPPNNTSIVAKTSTLIPHAGNYALRFLYPAGQAWAEQRFDMGTASPDAWFKFWLKVPTNFSHGGMNNKLFALWMDDYSSKGNGPTVIWESWGDGSGGSKLAVHWSEGGYNTAGVHSQGKQWITVPGDRGRWMEVVMHVKAATVRKTPVNPSSNPYLSSDGVIQLWRRWDGESSFTKVHEVTNANIAPPPGGPVGWRAGYLMGWANAAFPTNTEYLLDEFTISKESLLNTTTASTPTTTTPTTTSSPPSAPSSLKVQ